MPPKRKHGERGTMVSREERARRMAAGPPIAVERSVRQKGAARGPDNATLVLSRFTILVNTQWRPFNQLEEQHLRDRLAKTLETVFGKNNFKDYIDDFAQINWPEHRGDLASHVEGARFYYGVETGDTTSRGGRVHAHCMLFVAHRSNFLIDIEGLNKLLTQTWDNTRDAVYGEQYNDMFMNRGVRKFNVRAAFSPVDQQTHQWFYMNKNIRDLQRHLEHLAEMNGEEFEMTQTQ